MFSKLLTWVSFLALALFAAACSSSDAKPCQDDTDCGEYQYCAADGRCHPKTIPGDGMDGEDGGLDGDQAADSDQGPKPCENDWDCPPDKVCEVSSGECVAGNACQHSYNCSSDQYCDPDGEVCKDRSELCEPCATDEQCPDPGMGDMCVSYPDGNYCGQSCGARTCPVGYDCDRDSGSGTGVNWGQCISNEGTCDSTFVCHTDDDCAANKVCDKNSGKCKSKCQDIGCAAGLVCHATGHCGTACAADGDCAIFGSGLVCCTAAGVPVSYCTADSIGVCRPSGCVLHAECEILGGNSLGYCDNRTGECKTGCRIGGEKDIVSDCKAGYKCDCTNGTATCDLFDCCPDPGKPEACKCNPELDDCSQVSVCDDGECIKIPCYERGVEIACAAHNLCCGFPIDDGYTCPGGVTAGDCYTAPKDQWCAPCSEEGKSCQTPNLGYGEPGVCLSDEDSNTYCHPACRDTDDCPATWQCNYAYIQGCQDASNCESTATCEVVYRYYDDNQQLQEVSGCMCQTDADCPSDINGFQAVCIDTNICANADDPTDCHQGKICKFAKACLSGVGCPALNQ